MARLWKYDYIDRRQLGCGLLVDKDRYNADGLVLHYFYDFVGAFSAGCFETDLISYRLSHERLSQR